MKRWLIAIVLITPAAWSHPVAFQGSTSVLSFNSKKMNELMLGYSFSPRLAVAATYLRDTESKSEFYIPRVNFLMKRWNREGSQGNIYITAGSGVEKQNSIFTGAHTGQLIADWESRTYYVSAEHTYIRRGYKHPTESQDYNHSKVRAGFAPFKGDYNDLNIWFITQFDRHQDEDQIDATQFLRFYLKNVLWEIGASFDGSLAFNFMLHL